MKHKVEELAGASIHRIVPETTVDSLTADIKKEASRRIGLIANDWQQRNAIMDNDTETIAKIKAVRDASNSFESLLTDMTQGELDDVDVAEWWGWPDD
jgi:lipoate synthase